MPEQDISKRLALAKEIAVEAGQHTLKYFQRDNFNVERKSDRSPVTVADREAEQILRDRPRSTRSPLCGTAHSWLILHFAFISVDC